MSEELSPAEKAEIAPERIEQIREQGRCAKAIAEQLHETEEESRQQIKRIVKRLGIEQANALLQETLAIEQNGGMMLPDKSRRRTPGGVWFQLAKAKLPPKLPKPQAALIPAEKPAPVASPPPSKKVVAPASLPQLTWDERFVVLDELSNEKGTASTVKITLIGRPGKIVDKGTCIVTVIQANKVPALPKGLPVPPAVTTNYVVYIAAKQWKHAAGVVNDEEDVLIVEGFPQMDTKTGSIAVFATNTTTKKLQAAKRQQQQQQAAGAQG